MYMYFSMYMCKRPCNARPAALFVCFPSQGKEYRFRLMEIKGDISQRVDVRDPQGPQIRGMLGDQKNNITMVVVLIGREQIVLQLWLYMLYSLLSTPTTFR